MTYIGTAAFYAALKEGDGLALKSLRETHDKTVGPWLSAALEDPAVCADMKADIEAWFMKIMPVPHFDHQLYFSDARKEKGL